MTRQSRLLLVLLLIAAAGIGGLTAIADQYRKALSPEAVAARRRPPENPSTRAARMADGFLAVRRAAQSLAASHPRTLLDSADLSPRYRFARAAALSDHRMTGDDYAAVRAMWRTWRAGGAVDDRALLAAFESRKDAFEGADLGANEVADDAIN